MARAQTPPVGQLNQRHLFALGGASELPQLQEDLPHTRLALVVVSWARWAPEVECCRLHRSRARLGDDRRLREHLTLDSGGRVILFFTSLQSPDPAMHRGIGTISASLFVNLAAITAWIPSTGLTFMWTPSIAATFDTIQSRPFGPAHMPVRVWLVSLANSDKHDCTAAVSKFMSPATIKIPLSPRRAWAWPSVFLKACDLNFSLIWGFLPGTTLD